MIKATPIQTWEKVTKRGGILGEQRVTRDERVWRVQMRISATQWFTSNRKYASYESASAAASRITKKFAEAA